LLSNTGKGARWRALLGRALHSRDKSSQTKVERNTITGGPAKAGEVESSSMKSSPPQDLEYLAAPQIRGILRRPRIWNISPPLKSGKYLAAPGYGISRRPTNKGNTSPPRLLKLDPFQPL